MKRKRVRVGPSTIQIGSFVLLALLFVFPVPVAADGQCAGGFGAGNYLHREQPTDLLSDMPQGTVEFCVLLEQHANPPAHLANSCVGKRDAGNGYPPLTIRVRPDGRIFANWYPVAPPGSRDFFSESVIDVNEWVHVAFTWDGTFWRVYINGVEDAALADPSGLRQASDRVWLGDDPWVGELTLKGRLDNVRISNVARQPGGFGTIVDVNTVALWLLDGNGLDETGAYDLIEVGSISWSQSCSCGRCGDGTTAGLDECDDNNTDPGDGCSATCTEEPGWTCVGEPSVCTPICGDGIIVGSEACDDGNNVDCDGCRSDCSAIEGTCGDGDFDPLCEACDDGNTDDCDGCRGDCSRVEGTCGDAEFDLVCEQCDDGNASNNDDCVEECTLAECGDGFVWNEGSGSEECDDGNTDDGDGCSSQCVIEAGCLCTGVQSVCVCTPATPGGPHDVRKNRFLSFAPNNGPLSVALRLELLDQVCRATGKRCTSSSDCKTCVGGGDNGSPCSIDSDCSGEGNNCELSGEPCDEQSPPVSLGWIDDPFDPATDRAPGAFGAAVTETMPPLRTWTEDVVHVTDCEIAPAFSYAISATRDGQTFSDPLILATVPAPQGKHWGDVVGNFNGVVWSAPNGLVNVDDVNSVIKFITLNPAPHITVVELGSEVPSWLINATDLQLVIKAFKGELYPPPAFPTHVCEGGPDDGQPCNPLPVNADCPEGACTGFSPTDCP